MSAETHYTIAHSQLVEWKELLEIGLENTQSALIEHDAVLGRTTRKNREWAETLESDIERMKVAVQRIHALTNIGP